MTPSDPQDPVEPARTGVGSGHSLHRLYSRSAGWRRRSALIAGVVIVAAVAVWIPSSQNGSGAHTALTGPKLFKPVELTAMSGVLGHPVFWAGHRPGARTEFREDAGGNIQVRYLTGMAGDGTVAEGSLNITTYPYPGAYRATLDLARARNIRVVRTNRGIGFLDPKNPYFVVLAWPSHPDLQVKVFDPVRYRALKMVRSGEIVPLP